MNNSEFDHMAERKTRRRRRDEEAGQLSGIDHRDSCDECGAPEITYSYSEYYGAKRWTETVIQHVVGCSNE